MNENKDILYFYKFPCGSKIPEINIDKSYSLTVFKPTITKLKLHPDRLLLYIFWYVFTSGRYRIYYVRNQDGKVIHYSHLLPKFFKFPYMKVRDYEIGPCWTDAHYRGQRIYPYTISRIIKENCESGRVLYMMTDQENVPSQKGIEKAGFKLFSKGAKTGLLGKYIPLNIP